MAARSAPARSSPSSSDVSPFDGERALEPSEIGRAGEGAGAREASLLSSLDGPNVASVLEGAQRACGRFPICLPFNYAQSGSVTRARAMTTWRAWWAISLHDRLHALWDGLRRTQPPAHTNSLQRATKAIAALGIDLDAARGLRRRFAYACLDWSERRPHLAGALGAALLGVVLKRKWVTQDLDSRALRASRLWDGAKCARGLAYRSNPRRKPSDARGAQAQNGLAPIAGFQQQVLNLALLVSSRAVLQCHLQLVRSPRLVAFLKIGLPPSDSDTLRMWEPWSPGF